MKLSILVTFYNQEQFVDFTLNNILSMNHPFDYEIIIGEDGSSDNTLSKVKKWAESHTSIISYYSASRDKNKTYNPIERASLLRSELLRRAKGEYVAFLDGDDFYFDKDKFVKQIKVLDTNSSLAMAASNCYLYWSDEKKEALNANRNKSKVIKAKDYWRYLYFHISTFLFRNVFLNKKLDFDTKNYDDNYIVFSFLKYGDVYFSSDITTCYRQAQESVWNTIDEFNQNVTNLLDYVFETKYNPAFKKESLYRHLKEFKYLKHVSFKDDNISKSNLYRLESNNIDLPKLIDTKISCISAKMFMNKVIRKLRRI